MSIPSSAARGLSPGPLAIMETGAALLAVGLTMDDVARHLAVQHELDPDRVLALYQELRTARPSTCDGESAGPPPRPGVCPSAQQPRGRSLLEP